MIDRVLEFLGVEDPHKQAYMNYNTYLKSTNRKVKSNPQNSATPGGGGGGGKEFELLEISPPKLTKDPSVVNDNLPYFTCYCRDY